MPRTPDVWSTVEWLTAQQLEEDTYLSLINTMPNANQRQAQAQAVSREELRFQQEMGPYQRAQYPGDMIRAFQTNTSPSGVQWQYLETLEGARIVPVEETTLEAESTMTSAYSFRNRSYRGADLDYLVRASFGELRAWVKHIIAEAPNNMEPLKGLVQYIAQIKYHEETNNFENMPPRHVVRSARNKINRLLSIMTGIPYDRCAAHDYELVHPNLTMHADGDVYCPEHYEELCDQCSDCGDSSRRENLQTVDGELICNACYSREGHYFCSPCGENHRGDYECEHCAHERGRGGPIHNYSEDVTETLHSFRKTEMEERLEDKTGKKIKLFFGVELEVLPRRGITQKTASKAVQRDLDRFALLKRDGSLTDDGFEIVTAPATLAFHRETIWTKFFEEGGSAEKVKSWNTKCCGLHVHFSKEALSPMQLAKIVAFIHDPDNNKFLTRLAGRDINSNAEFCPAIKKTIGGISHKNMAGKVVQFVNVGVEEAESHYNAINTSGNEGKTCEVRIFRGNASRHGVMRALDFVAASIEFAGEVEVGLVNETDMLGKTTGIKKYTGLTYQSFLAWFNKPMNRARFPDLWKQLIATGYLETKHTFKAVQTDAEGKTSLRIVALKSEPTDGDSDERFNDDDEDEDYDGDEVDSFYVDDEDEAISF